MILFFFSIGTISSQVTASFQAAGNNCEEYPITSTNNSTGANAYTWLFIQPSGDTIMSNEFEPTFYPPDPGDYVIKLIATDGVNIDTAIQNMSLNQLPPLDLGPDTVLCPGSSITLFGGWGANYSWSTGAFDVATIKVTEAGIYWEQYDNGLCTNHDTIIITLGIIPEKPNLGPDIETCGDTTLQVINGPFFAYLWDTGEETDSIKVDTSGTFTVTIKNSDYCENYDTIQVICNQIPDVDLGSDTTLLTGQTLALTPNSQYGIEPISDASGIEFASNKGSTLTNDFSLALWIKLSEKSFQYYGGLISKGDGSKIQDMSFLWFLRPDHKVALDLRNQDDSLLLISDVELDTLNEYQLVATLSPTETKLYANGVEIGSAGGFSVQDNGGSWNFLRAFNEQYNPTLGNCSAKNAIMSSAYVWDTTLTNTEVSNWYNDSKSIPQEEKLLFNIDINNNKGNSVINKINNEKGTAYDLKKFRGKFPFEEYFNPYYSVSWNTGETTYGIEKSFQTNEDVMVTVSNDNCSNSDTITVIVNDTTTNTGNVTVYYQDGNPVNHGFIKLWGINWGCHKYMMGLYPINNGIVDFGLLDPGLYILHVIGIPGYRSFFYEDSHNPQGATIIVLNDGDIMDIHIIIPIDSPSKVKITSGKISGYLYYADTGKGKGIWKSKEKNNDPIPYEIVELNMISPSPLNGDDATTWYQTFMFGITDENGYYEIENIPQGKYIVYPNITAFDTIVSESYDIKVTDVDTLFEDIDYAVDSVTNSSENTTSVAKNDPMHLQIYPNPSQGWIHISSPETIEKIQVFNVTGQEITRNEVNNKIYDFSIYHSPSGMYIIRITTGHHQYSRRVLLE